MDNKQYLVPGSIIAAGLIIAVSVVFGSDLKLLFKSGPTALNPPGLEQPSKQEVAQVDADDDAFLGKADAPVTVIEFSDFQCPFCRRMYIQTLSALKKDYVDTGKIKFVYRDFPLTFHEGAQDYAEATECANDEGKFWQMHDKIFDEQEKLGQGTIPYPGRETLFAWAGQIGLNAGKFKECLESDKYKEEVEKDIQDGVTAGVQGTPATFVNGRVVSGAQPLTAFVKIIEEELQKSSK
jgi:protein-disulfide isomerase